ncbi:MAG: hypothetical protein ACC707_16315 [Thiohalomonadales bacterium]
MINASISYQKIRTTNVSVNDPTVANAYKAIVNYQNIRAADISVNIDSFDYRAIVSQQLLVADVTFVDPTPEHFGNYSNKHIWLLSPGVIINPVVMTDSVAKDVSREIQDSFLVKDSLSKDVTKELSDSTPITDSVVKDVTKTLSDSVSMTDSLSMSLYEEGIGGVNGSAVNQLSVNDDGSEVFTA